MNKYPGHPVYILMHATPRCDSINGRERANLNTPSIHSARSPRANARRAIRRRRARKARSSELSRGESSRRNEARRGKARLLPTRLHRSREGMRPPRHDEGTGRGRARTRGAEGGWVVMEEKGVEDRVRLAMAPNAIAHAVFESA